MRANGFNKWILVIAAALVVSFTVGGVNVYARVSVLENESKNLKEDITEIKKTVHRIEHLLTTR